MAENKNWICTVTGQTYPIRGSLQSWAFFWDPVERAWVNESVDSFMRRRIEEEIEDGDYPGCDFSWKEKPRDEIDDILDGLNG